MNPRQLRRKLELMVKNFEKKREVKCNPASSILECEDYINSSDDSLIISQLKITLYGFIRLKSKWLLTALFTFIQLHFKLFNGVDVTINELFLLYQTPIKGSTSNFIYKKHLYF